MKIINFALVKYIRDVLIKSDMPVWMTLLIMLFGGIITYFFVPYFNEEFEKQKIRTSYIIKNMETLNNDSVQFLNLLKRYNVVDKKEKKSNIYQELEDGITKLQWKILELNAVLGKEFYPSDVDDYIDSLVNITNELRKQDSYDRAYTLCEARKFIYASNNIVIKIADLVDLKIGDTTDPLKQFSGSCREIVAPPIPSPSSN